MKIYNICNFTLQEYHNILQYTIYDIWRMVYDVWCCMMYMIYTIYSAIQGYHNITSQLCSSKKYCPTVYPLYKHRGSSHSPRMSYYEVRQSDEDKQWSEVSYWTTFMVLNFKTYLRYVQVFYRIEHFAKESWVMKH